MTKFLSTLNAFAPRRPNIVACIVRVSLLWITLSKQHEFQGGDCPSSLLLGSVCSKATTPPPCHCFSWLLSSLAQILANHETQDENFVFNTDCPWLSKTIFLTIFSML